MNLQVTSIKKLDKAHFSSTKVGAATRKICVSIEVTMSNDIVFYDPLYKVYDEPYLRTPEDILNFNYSGYEVLVRLQSHAFFHSDLLT